MLKLILALSFSILIISCSKSTEVSVVTPTTAPDNDGNSKTGQPNASAAADTIVFPESELEFDAGLFEEKNSFENVKEDKVVAEKTFIVRPQHNGSLSIRLSFQATDNRTVYPMYTYLFQNSRGEGIPSKSSATGDFIYPIVASEIYRFKVAILSKKMKVTVQPKWIIANPADEASATGAEGKLLSVPKKISCQARSTNYLGEAPKRTVTIVLDTAPTPLVDVTSSDPEINFKIGREFVGGRLVEKNS